jgi:hypothetical protein
MALHSAANRDQPLTQAAEHLPIQPIDRGIGVWQLPYDPFLLGFAQQVLVALVLSKYIGPLEHGLPLSMNGIHLPAAVYHVNPVFD